MYSPAANVNMYGTATSEAADTFGGTSNPPFVVGRSTPFRRSQVNALVGCAFPFAIWMEVMIS